MSRLFLPRLLKHSRLAGICVIIYILLYSMLMSKGMFIQFFPSNAMFASLPAKGETLHTYALFANGRKVMYSHKPYWKKDLMEASLPLFIRVQDTAFSFPLAAFMEKYPATKVFHGNWLPGSPDTWPSWYAHTGGIALPIGSNVQVYRYAIEFTDGQMAVKDSQLVYPLKAIQ